MALVIEGKGFVLPQRSVNLRNILTINRQGFYVNGKMIAPNPVRDRFESSITIPFNSPFRGRWANLGRWAKLGRWLGETLKSKRQRQQVKQYTEEVLPLFLAKASGLEDLKEWDRVIERALFDYKEAFINPIKSFVRSLDSLMMFSNSIAEVKTYKFLVLQLFFGRQKLAGGRYSMDIMLDCVKVVKSLADLDEFKKKLQHIMEDHGSPTFYLRYLVKHVLPNVKSPAELDKARRMTLDFIVRFGGPMSYVERVFPALAAKVNSVCWEEWDREAKALILRHCRETKTDPKDAIMLLVEVFEKCNSIEDLRGFKITPEMTGKLDSLVAGLVANGIYAAKQAAETNF